MGFRRFWAKKPPHPENVPKQKLLPADQGSIYNVKETWSKGGKRVSEILAAQQEKGD